MCLLSRKLAGEQAKIVGWSKDSKPVYNDNIFYEIVKNGGTKQVLTLRNFTEKHAGKYECIAELNKKRKSCSVVVQREGMYFVCVLYVSVCVYVCVFVICTSCIRDECRYSFSFSERIFWDYFNRQIPHDVICFDFCKIRDMSGR